MINETKHVWQNKLCVSYSIRLKFRGLKYQYNTRTALRSKPCMHNTNPISWWDQPPQSRLLSERNTTDDLIKKTFAAKQAGSTTCIGESKLPGSTIARQRSTLSHSVVLQTLKTSFLNDYR